MHFTWVDYVILAILLLSALGGLYRGFIREVFAVLTWVAAIIVACIFTAPLANFLSETSFFQSAVLNAHSTIGVDASQHISWITMGVSFLLLFLGVFLIGALISMIVSGILEAGGIGFINRILGAIFGFLRGFVIIVVLIFALQYVPQIHDATAWTNSSLIKNFQPAVDWLSEFVKPEVDTLSTKVKGQLEKVKVKGAPIEDHSSE